MSRADEAERRPDPGPDGPSAARPAAPSPAVDRADYDPRYDPDAPILCEVCGATMVYTASCKIVCRTCGYMRDCSDP